MICLGCNRSFPHRKGRFCGTCYQPKCECCDLPIRGRVHRTADDVPLCGRCARELSEVPTLQKPPLPARGEGD